MKIRFVLISALIVWSSVSIFAVSKEELAERAISAVSKEELAERAISADSAVSADAIKNLRTLGHAGFDALRAKYSAEIAAFAQTGEATDEWKRIAFALDSVAMQKDAYASNLFWLTDFEEAKKQAARSNKPILSLRLLGNLNEEFSCANSRFFRALLYSNTDISKFLRENYVLHWKSVRPAPKVTIDFGDGRKIERTLTGNSIHYITDENGAVLDALPGLYAPSDFLKYLRKALEINKTVAALPVAQRENAMLRYRRAMFNEIIGRRNQAVQTAKIALTEPKDGTTALEVAPRAVTKSATEVSILRELNDDFSRFEPQINLDDWKKLSALYAAGTNFDAASIAFIKRQNAKNGLTETQFSSLLVNLRTLVALDTTRNDFLFHTKLYEWLNQQRAKPLEIESFNARVYDELFKTPDSDKWLGLYTTDVYTALDGNGIIR